jgi:hypothetical protein
LAAGRLRRAGNRQSQDDYGYQNGCFYRFHTPILPQKSGSLKSARQRQVPHLSFPACLVRVSGKLKKIYFYNIV